MTGYLLDHVELIASISSRGMALSQWVDAQPEPWAGVLRWSPLAAAFLLGMLLVWLWEKKPVKVESVAPREELVELAELEKLRGELTSTCLEKSQTQEKLLLLQKELKAALQENLQQNGQIESVQRVLEVKDQVVEDLRVKLASLEAMEPDRAMEAVRAEEALRILEQEERERGAAMDDESAGGEVGEDLQAFAAASEQLARVAVDFRNQTREALDAASEPGEGSSSSLVETEENVKAEGKDEVMEDWQELLLFVSTDPSIWNQEVNDSEHHFAISLNRVPQDVAFLRMRRLDTGEGIVLAVGHQDLASDGGEDKGIAFNGSHEEFYGAYHLGVYSETLPQEVEVRFAFGGWGFGHRASAICDSFALSCDLADSVSADKQTAQACAWAGREIDSSTLIEIVVFPRLPDLAEGDQLL